MTGQTETTQPEAKPTRGRFGLIGAGILAAAVLGGAGFLVLTAGGSGPAEANTATKEEVLANPDFGRPGDIVLGDPDAPVEIIEYASMTCGHCAAFKLRTFPEIKEQYIDTGKAKYTLREFPTAPVVLSASAFMLARCVPEDRYYRMIEVLFKTQRTWAGVSTAQEGRDELEKIARQAGLNSAAFEACLSNDAEYQRIRAVQEQGSEAFEITGTPSLIINGEMLNGFRTFEDVSKVIEAKLAE